MGRFYTILMLVGCFSNTGLAQFSWERPGLRGHVREIYAEREDFDSSTTRAAGKRVAWYREHYDESGLLGLVTFFNSGTGEANNTWSYAFDGDKHSAVATVSDAKGQLLWKEVYSLGNNGKPVGGRLFGADGSSKTEYSFVYDAGARLTEWLRIQPDGRKYTKNRYRYDNLGRLIEETSFLADGNFASNNIYAYDSRGQIIQADGFDDSGKEHHWKYEYKYDLIGNWIECRKSGRSRTESKYEIEEIIFRAVSYFEK